MDDPIWYLVVAVSVAMVLLLSLLPWWDVVAWVVTRQSIRNAILTYAFRRPYYHTEGYMRRWWLFNPYGTWWGKRLPSIRIHAIQRGDTDRHLHDHPWTFRSIILMGGYDEIREGGERFSWRAGETHVLPHRTYHRVLNVDDKWGAVTMFITYRKRGSWGFKVNGEHVPWRTYLNRPENA